MFQNLVIKWVISYVLTALETAQGKIDWAAITALVDGEIRKFLPSFLAEDLVALANEVMAVTQVVLSDAGDLKKIMQLLAAEDFNGAFLALRDLILAAWTGSAQVPHMLRAIV